MKAATPLEAHRRPYHELSREASPTGAMAVLVQKLRDYQRPIIDAGQGSELGIPEDDDLSRFLNRDIKIGLKGEYHGAPLHGGAHFFRHFFRVNVNNEQTFAYEGHGRLGVGHAFNFAAFRHDQSHPDQHARPIILMPDLTWETLRDIARDLRFEVRCYDHTNPDIAGAIENIPDLDLTRVTSVLVNFPHNPTSQGTTREYMEQFMRGMDRINARPGVDMTAIFDQPYGYAAPIAKDARGEYLQTGLEHVFDTKWKTPWVLVSTMSKLLAAAQEGASLIAVDEESAKRMKGTLGRSFGMARIPAYMQNFLELVSGKHDHIIRARMDELREKYKINRGLVETLFSPHVIPGQPNMLSLLRIPQEKLLNREVDCCDGKKRVLRDDKDIMEWLANEHGIAIVGNGINDGHVYLRIAQREKPEVFAEGMYRLQKGLRQIEHAPVVGPSLSQHHTECATRPGSTGDGPPNVVCMPPPLPASRPPGDGHATPAPAVSG